MKAITLVAITLIWTGQESPVRQWKILEKHQLRLLVGSTVSSAVQHAKPSPASKQLSETLVTVVHDAYRELPTEYQEEVKTLVTYHQDIF